MNTFFCIQTAPTAELLAYFSLHTATKMLRLLSRSTNKFLIQ
jgi:hypothetical protein